MRRKKTAIMLTAGFLVGIFVLLYPLLSDYWNSKTQTRAIVNYESVLENLTKEDYSAVFEAAYAYNKALYETEAPLIHPDTVPGYYETLKLDENSIMMGYLTIDRIGVELPMASLFLYPPGGLPQG